LWHRPHKPGESGNRGLVSRISTSNTILLFSGTQQSCRGGPRGRPRSQDLIFQIQIGEHLLPVGFEEDVSMADPHTLGLYCLVGFSLFNVIAFIIRGGVDEGNVSFEKSPRIPLGDKVLEE
jgi:hypothetical protein